MAKKRRTRRPAGRRPQTGPRGEAAPAQAPRGGANPARRDRKEQARRYREAERKRAARRASVQRAMIFFAVGLAVLGAFWYFNRAPGVTPLAAEVRAAADAAGCGQITVPEGPAPSRDHIAPGASYDYPHHPATAGPHDPSALPIPPHTYTAPITETKAVHNLEHGSVIAYYRASGDGALGANALSALDAVADASKNSIAAPYPQLPDGTQVAFAAWNKLMTCSGPMSADQATTVFQGFIDSYQCTDNAPESATAGAC
jgi:Protein of unknown function (DUF3105)